MAGRYWLMKSEPGVFSFDDLKASPNATTYWEGVRNYQARNYMRDDMKEKDLVLFYHSSCEKTGIPGIAEITKEAYPDHTAWDPKSKYYDPKSSSDHPRWMMVEIKWKKKLKRFVTLREMKNTLELRDMKLVQKGQRLSVQPVTKKEFEKIYELGMSG